MVYWGRGNGFRWLAAGGLVVCSGASAAYLRQQPPSTSTPDVRPLHRLAQRLEESNQAFLTPAPLTLPVYQSDLPRAGTAHSRAARPNAPAVHARPRAAASAPAADPALTAASIPAASIPAATGLSPLQTLALIGVTTQGSSERAWLVDLQSHERFTAEEGQEVEGLKVRDIQPDRVILAGADGDHELRLGEKADQVQAENPAPPPAPTPAPKPQVAQNGGWGGGRRNWGGGGRRNAGGGSFGGRGGGNPGAFRQAAMNAAAAFRNNRGGFSGGGGNNSQPRLTHPTSNPQEARRRGVGLVGGVAALPEPSAYFNPQTVRRLGRTTGHAFGADDSRHTAQQAKERSSNSVAATRR